MSSRKRRGRGEGSVFQREDGWWVGSASLGFTPAGKRRRKVVYAETKAGVQEKLRALQHRADVGHLPDRADLTVGAWFAHWIGVITPTVEPGTLTPYRRHGERFVTPRLGRLKLARLRRAD